MLTKRIIPCLDVDKGRVVKGVSFIDIKDAGSPTELAEIYDREGADELIFLDITASSDSRDIMVDVVKSVSEKVFIPLTVGGGIRSVNDVRSMLEAGADKVSLNTAAVRNPLLIKDASIYFGCQCIVVAVDVKRVETPRLSLKTNGIYDFSLDHNSVWEVYTHGGRQGTGIDAVKWAKEVEKLGAGELLITSMDADGWQNGYDLDLLKEVSKTVNIPVIASGGAGEMEHFYEAANIAKVDAMLAASIFHFGKFTIGEVKEYLRSRGVAVRPIGIR